MRERTGLKSSVRVAASAIAAAAALVLVGCSDDDGNVVADLTDAPTDGPEQTDGPTDAPGDGGEQTDGPTEGPSFQGASDEDVQAAMTVIDEMVQATAQIGAGDLPIEELEPWAADDAYDYWDGLLSSTLDQGQTFEGEISVSVIEITQARADEIRIVTCRDVSELDVVAEDGTSVVVPERIDRARGTSVVTKWEWPQMTSLPNESGWIVTDDEVEPVPCG